MAYTLPNAAAATYPEQAEPHQADIDILVNGFNKCGVLGLTDCLVSAPGGTTTVAVAGGFAVVQGTVVQVTAGTVAVPIDPTNKAYVLIVSSAAGALSAIAGAPAPNPTKPAVPNNVAVLAEVFVPGGSVSITSGMIVDKRVILNSPQTLESLTRVMVVGHSLVAEGGASQLSFGNMHRLAQLFPAEFVNLAHGAACAVVPGNIPDSAGGVGGIQAGWGWVYDQCQNRERTAGINTTLGATIGPNYAAGTSALVGASAGWAGSQPVMVGRGATAELTYIAGSLDATHVSFVDILVNQHVAGEPVVAVPDAWQMARQLVILEYEWNDLAWMGPTIYGQAFIHAYRAIIARLRSCAQFEDDSVLCRVTSGSFTTQTPGAGYASGGKYLRPVAAGAQITCDIPPLEAGMELPLMFITEANGDGALWTISVNGGAGITHDTRNINGAGPYNGGAATRAANGKAMASVKILRAADGLAAGTNTITVTATTLQGTGGGFDGFSVMPVERPPMIVQRPDRRWTYTLWAAPLYVPNDADQATMDAAILTLIAEFTPTDPTLIAMEKDSVINKQKKFFYSDGAHYNDRGHAEVALKLAQTLNAAIIPLRSLMMTAPVDKRGWYVIAPTGAGVAGTIELKTGWAAYPGGVAPGYFKDIARGRVELRGEIYNNSGNPALNPVLFTLPVGHRPMAQLQFVVNTAGAQQNIWVEANGDVKVGGIQGFGATTQAWLSLSGINFSAEQ